MGDPGDELASRRIQRLFAPAGFVEPCRAGGELVAEAGQLGWQVLRGGVGWRDAVTDGLCRAEEAVDGVPEAASGEQGGGDGDGGSGDENDRECPKLVIVDEHGTGRGPDAGDGGEEGNEGCGDDLGRKGPVPKGVQEVRRTREQVLSKMLAIIKSNPGIRPSELNRRLNLTQSDDLRDALVRKGLVRKVKEGHATLLYAK